jgi:hypothetical protein
MAAYIRAGVARLRSQPASELLAGRILFEAPSGLCVEAGAYVWEGSL